MRGRKLGIRSFSFPINSYKISADKLIGEIYQNNYRRKGEKRVDYSA